MTSPPESRPMRLSLKLHKSAGVPVSAAVHRLIQEGNAARGAQQWELAAAKYAEALELDPQLAHIWIQYGHMSKEAGDHAAAAKAYAAAARLDPTSAEPHLRLGQLSKRQGDLAAASGHYVKAAQLDPHDPNTLSELHEMLHRNGALPHPDLLDVLKRVLNDSAPAEADAAGAVDAAQTTLQQLALTLQRDGADGDAALAKLSAATAILEEMRSDVSARVPSADEEQGPALVFDVSDLIAYFRDSRLPTGIQRVQIEIITHALGAAGAIRICCFAQERDAWLEIPPNQFALLARLSLASGDRGAAEWVGALTRLHLHFSMAEAFAFPAEAFLINLGTSWWIANYFLSVRQAKAAEGANIRYVPFVHDLIPLLAPQHCSTGLVREFVAWTAGVFAHADFFLCNSEATKRDLIRVAGVLGHALDPAAIRVIRLDADFRKDAAPKARRPALRNFGLGRGNYVLFVSTIEPRKNHLLAFEAWLELARRRGVRQVPMLVCVGKRGWMEETILARLQAHEELKDRVLILSGLSDAELADLYDGCLFTLYPSSFEGWGLPVTESLCHGKVPLISDGSSLPEAGGPFAVYFPAESAAGLTAAAERLIYDQGYRQRCEEKIARTFQPRSWPDLAAEVGAAVKEWAQAPSRHDGLGAFADLGAFHTFARNRRTGIWRGLRSAEVFRSGSGWWGQDDFGSWTKAQGAILEFRLRAPHGPLQLAVQLRGLPRATTTAILADEGETARTRTTIAAGESKWVSLVLPGSDAAQPVHQILIRSHDFEDLGEVTGGQDRRLVGVGVAGFFVCEQMDVTARLAFMEGLAFGNLDDLGYERELPSGPIDIQRLARFPPEQSVEPFAPAAADAGAQPVA